ncbi:MAG: glycosyltransferase, partial [Nanoarchaeota archaeon]
KPSLANLSLIKEKIKETDIVFIQGPAMASFLGIYYGHKYHKPTLLYTHTIIWELFEKFAPKIIRRLFFRILKWGSIQIYNRCTEILVPYHELKSQLEREGITAPISVARLGVDIDQFSPTKDKTLAKTKLGISPESFVIGYVGRVSKEKNMYTLREAFRKLRHKKRVFLLIVGDGPEKEVQPFKELRNCQVTGFVNNVEDYLKAMDLFIMPSLTETTSLATLEAMSTGLPVIATKVGFIKQYLVKGHNGLFFPRNSSTLLAIKIDQLMRNRELREKLAQNARKTVTYSFSWDRSMNKIKRLLGKHYE